ncbi:bifunctional nuclease family protein [Methanolobus sp. ZRKC3]|uniref:bifunctional nuclease family protein n=1 Tax=Methanolobus sp. ZRKC3 TaxID=3125786 RepID=UPI00324BF332
MNPAEDIKEITVKGVYMLSMMGKTVPAVMLEDEEGNLLPINIGNSEAVSINSVMKKETMPRPMTHDLMDSMIKRLGVKVEGVLIDEKVDSVYYAMLMLNKDGVRMEFDARPSDCIAIALRDEAPIMIDSELFANDSVSKDQFHSSRDGVTLE